MSLKFIKEMILWITGLVNTLYATVLRMSEMTFKDGQYTFRGKYQKFNDEIQVSKTV